MKLLKQSMPFSALGIFFILAGIMFTDPKQISFGVVWFIIASAKLVFVDQSKKVKKSN
jgi:hypothetical protein